MKVLRTPDERFANLAEFPFAPHWLNVGRDPAMRVHFVDEGPRDGAPVLLLHGEPSWSFLYRKMIPILAKAGHRVVAPDLVGFGKSDKPAAREDYTYQRHVDWMTEFLLETRLTHVTLFCQDWGGLIGLRLVAEHPNRFARVVAANTGLPTGDQKPSEAFFAWQKFSQTVPEFPTSSIIKSGCVSPLPPEALAAYDAPFPDETYKAGARQFPLLVPSSPDNPAAGPNKAAWEKLATFTKPFLTAFSDSDPVTRGAERPMHKLIPGAKGQPHVTIAGGGHFLQEDKGEELAKVILEFVARTP